MSMYIVQYWSNGLNQITVSYDGLPALSNLFEEKEIKFKVIGVCGLLGQNDVPFDDVRNPKPDNYRYWLDPNDSWLKEIK